MPKNIHTGKRVMVTMPRDIYAVLEAWGRREMRNDSQAVLFLVQEGLRSRGLLPEIDEPPTAAREEKR